MDCQNDISNLDNLECTEYMPFNSNDYRKIECNENEIIVTWHSLGWKLPKTKLGLLITIIRYQIHRIKRFFKYESTTKTQ